MQSMRKKTGAQTCADAFAQKALSSALVHATPECSSKMPVVPNIKKRLRRICHENRCHPPISNGLHFDLQVKDMQTLKDSDPGSGKQYLKAIYSEIVQFAYAVQYRED